MASERKIYEERDVKKEEIEQRSFNIIYGKEIELWMEIRKILESNWMKAYAHIFNKCCSRSMHISIVELPYYEDNIINDTLVLLESLR